MKQELTVENDEVECDCPSFTPIRKRNKHVRASKKHVKEGVRVSIYQTRINAPEGFYEWKKNKKSPSFTKEQKAIFLSYIMDNYTWEPEYIAYSDPKGVYFAIGGDIGKNMKTWINGVNIYAITIQEWNGIQIPKNIVPWKS